MSEYTNVEKPFLEKLNQLGWEVIEQGFGIPQDPSKSLRNSFKEVVLEKVFKESVNQINLTKDGKEWLTEKQLDEIFREVTIHIGKNLHEANKAVHELLIKGTGTDRNELTGENTSQIVKLIDFKNPENNSFIAINQFRIVTPGGPREGIIPDIVLFVNGLPLVVIECKDKDVSEPLSEAEIQIRRYSNRREDDYGVKEGEEKLFYFNLFSIITHGEEARVGSISADFDYYFNWKDIFPEEYKTIQVTPDEQRQEVLIRGMLNKEIFIDILKHFTLFMEVKKGTEVKIICRYPQYRAVGKTIERLRNNQSSKDKGGVIWHTQGSGKSLTMVFLVKKIRSCEDLKDYKIIMVNDRTDLEDQLFDTAQLTNEKVNVINHRRDLRDTLSNNSSDLNMVMVHKFLEEEIRHSKALMKAYVEEGEVPEFKPFEMINSSEKILLLIDEAHRTQGGQMSENLCEFAFPHSVKIGFTGTPLLTDRYKQKTYDRFGSPIDTYKMDQSVKDRATLDIVYIGRTSKDHILDKEVFDTEFEDMFRNRTDEEKEEIRKRYGTMTAYLESKDRIKKIAEDIVEHYTREVLVNGFKAQVVGSSIVAAARYKKEIEIALRAKIEKEKSKSDTERDDEYIKQMEFVKVCLWVTQIDNNELGYISEARREAKEMKAVENFKKDFDLDKPETGVGILCVCDRLLTGFDAPIEQVMYLDKYLREHDLLQAIARVNRTKGPNKNHGIVVDYYGVAQNLKEALGIYTDSDENEMKDFLNYFRDINKEVPVLEARYKRLINLFKDKGVKKISDFVNQRMADKGKEFDVAERCIELAKEIKFRAEFDTYLKSFFDSLDLLFNVSQGKEYWIPAKRFGYLLIRIRNRYKDETLDLKWAGEKVRKLIDKHLISEGIDSKIPPVKLLSKDFPKEIEKFSINSRSKASEMEHAIRRHIKVNIEKDPTLYSKFKDRLENIINRYKENWDGLVTEFGKIKDDIEKGRPVEEEGISKEQAPFYDIIKNIAFEDIEIDIIKKEKLKNLTSKILQQILEAIIINNFWSKESEIRRLQGELDDELQYCDIPEVSIKHDQITTELKALAKVRDNELKNTENA